MQHGADGAPKVPLYDRAPRDQAEITIAFEHREAPADQLQRPAVGPGKLFAIA